MRFISLAFLILLTLAPALRAEVQVSARFNPPRVALGDPAQYIVAITESGSGQIDVERITALQIPQPDGLNLRNLRSSNSQQTRIINGAVENSITQSLIIDAAPAQIGRYTIPAYSFDYKGERVEIPATSLEVVERSADAGPSRDELVFLQAELPETLYSGQTITFELKLYMAEDVRLSGLNSFNRNADGFTISELPNDYHESVETLAGRRYRVLSWPLTLTPIRTGGQPISFQFALTARLPGQERNRDPFGRSPFGGSLFEDFFGRTERLNVYTDPLTIEVKPLPTAGRPAGYSGAIGDFAMEVATDAEQARQGEPIMLSVVLKGRGNFDRINGPSFSASPDWRHYDPERKFDAGDPLSMSGSLRFDYVFIPQRSGRLQLPETRFSYFDPVAEEYIELNAPPIPVEVAAAPHSPAPAPTTAIIHEPAAPLKLSHALSPPEALLTLDYRPQPARPVGYAILRSPLFIGLNTLAGLLIAGCALALHRRQRQRADPSYPIRAAARQGLRQARQAYLQALQQNDAASFFQHGQQAIRHAAAIRSGRSMHSAHSRDIECLLSGQAAADCRAFFESANAHRFGGHNPQTCQQAQQHIENILKAL